MYNKFLICLEDMCYEYREFERIHFAKSKITAFNVVEVHKSFNYLYFEFSEDGDAYIWSSEGELVSITIKNKDYIMLFRLAGFLQSI